MAGGNIPGQNKTLIPIFTDKEITLSIYRNFTHTPTFVTEVFPCLVKGFESSCLYINKLQHNTKYTLKLPFTD